MKFNCYKKQLDHVLASDDITGLKIKVIGEHSHTNYLAINLESIEEITRFLGDVKRSLESSGSNN